MAGIPTNLSNPVLSFLLRRAIDKVFDVLILEVEQTWRLLSEVASEVDAFSLDPHDLDYKDLKRIRDKLVAHRIEVSLATTENLEWYAREYGSYERVFALVTQVTEKLRSEIQRLLDDGKLRAAIRPIKHAHAISQSDIDQLVEALRKQGIL